MANNQNKPSTELLDDLNRLVGKSWNRNFILRQRIRSVNSAGDLVKSYNILVKRIRRNGSISANDKDFIQAMQQEGMEEGGKFRNIITEVDDEVAVGHQNGISHYSEQMGRVEIVCGFTKLSTWRLMSSKKNS